MRKKNEDDREQMRMSVGSWARARYTDGLDIGTEERKVSCTGQRSAVATLDGNEGRATPRRVARLDQARALFLRSVRHGPRLF